MLVQRILPNKDLKDEIINIQSSFGINSGVIICAVGSLKEAVLRMSNEKLKQFKGPLEIVSIQGTISPDGIHLHLSISDTEGKVWGGHLKNGCKVHTTVELCVMEYSGQFRRKLDPETGFKELVVD